MACQAEHNEESSGGTPRETPLKSWRPTSRSSPSSLSTSPQLPPSTTVATFTMSSPQPAAAAPAANEPAAEPAAAAAAPEAATTDEATILPGQHWANLHQNDDDGSSLLGQDEESTASLRSSILQYRSIAGRTYHGDVGEAEYW